MGVFSEFNFWGRVKGEVNKITESLIQKFYLLLIIVLDRCNLVTKSIILFNDIYQ